MQSPPFPAQESASPLAGRTILQIIPRLDAGGAERTAIDVAAALADVGARALVASEGGRLAPDLQAVGGIFVPFPAATKNPLAMASAVGRLTRLIRDENVDIVHARSRAPAWVAHIAARRTQTPFVTTYHGSYAGRSAIKLLYNSVMARGDLVIANSEYTAGLIARLYPEAVSRVRVINRGTDFRTFAPAHVDPARVQSLREAWGAPPEDRLVLLAGRLTGWKGQRVLIEAARILASRGVTGVRYILAGDDQGRRAYVRELERRVSAAGLEGVVRIVGHCADMPAALLAAAVVALPSTEPEAFGRVAVEAQAMGAPLVVSDIGATAETVLAPPRWPAAARTGWRVRAGDATEFADAIAEALSLGATARESLALRARTHVLAHFSLRRMTDDTLDAYAAMLHRGA